MAQNKFHHLGVPVNTKQENETYLEGGKVYITDPDTHPYRVEYLRFEADSPMPDALKNNAHAAFMVESIEDAMKGKDIVLEPFDATDTLRIGFINDNGAIIELMQEK